MEVLVPGVPTSCNTDDSTIKNLIIFAIFKN